MCLYTTSLFNTNYVLKTHLAFTQTSLKFLIQTRSQTHVYIKYVLHVFTPNSFSTNELSHPYGRPSQRNAPAKSSKAAGATHHWIVWEDFQTKPTRRQIELTWNLGPSGLSHGERPLRCIPQNRVAHSCPFHRWIAWIPRTEILNDLPRSLAMDG